MATPPKIPSMRPTSALTLAVSRNNTDSSAKIRHGWRIRSRSGRSSASDARVLAVEENPYASDTTLARVSAASHCRRVWLPSLVAAQSAITAVSTATTKYTAANVATDPGLPGQYRARRLETSIAGVRGPASRCR